MFSDDKREDYLKNQKDEEKRLRKIMRDKGKYLKRAESAFDSLTDAEKIVIDFYFNDENMSLGAAVIKSGLADSSEDAVRIARALENNKKFQEAIEEIKSLGGITPMMIKHGILEIAKDSDNDPAVKLKAWMALADLTIPKQVIKVVDNTPIDATEIKKRLSSLKNDAVAEAAEFIARLKSGDENENSQE